MTIEAVVTSTPCLDWATDAPPGWRDDLRGPNAARCWWIVPTSRRRRAILHSESPVGGRLPRVLTIEGLLQHLAGFSTLQQPVVGNAARLLRVARAWRQVKGPEASLTPGRVLQLDEIAQEWRESGELPGTRHPHSAFVRAYLDILKKDRCVDRPGWIAGLANEMKDESSALALQVAKARTILFDGFHRFTEEELKLIEALSKKTDVRLWLVGEKGQPFHANVEKVIERLKIAQHISIPCEAKHPEIEILEANKPADEIDAVARRIKQLTKERGDDARLADIAVVVPDDSYTALVRTTLTTAEIACAPAAERFALADSRPARTILAALRIVKHGWPSDAVFDFLRQPLVHHHLKPNYRLDLLQRLCPPGNEHRDLNGWKQAWSAAINLHERGGGDEDDKRDDDPEKRKKAADDLRELLVSIDSVFAPVQQLQKELSVSEGDSTRLATAVAKLLDAVGLVNWLSPTLHPNWQVVPAREWEIDQLAFNNLKDVLAELAETPIAGFDAETVLNLVLAAESFQTGADDDAGVQIVKARQIRGLKFRALFAVGLVEGKVPAERREDLPDSEPASAPARLRQELALEQEYLFAQLFESASERIILSRPLREGDAEVMESPFLRRVKAKIGFKESMPAPTTIVDRPRALLHAERLSADQRAELKPFLDARDTWRKAHLVDAPLQIQPWALPLLKLRYPADRPFSATALERYASCPFQHFTTKTLGLEEFERDDRALNAGLFVHDVLERFFKEWQKQHANRAFEPVAARQLFDRLFNEAWTKQAATLEPSLGHDFRKALAEAFIKVSEHLDAQGFRQVAAEWEIDDLEIKDQQGRSIKLYGFIDRVDRRTKGQEIEELICDFKTGFVYTAGKLAKRIEHGRLLQLPLYGLARQLKANVPVRHGIYVRLSRKVKEPPAHHGPFMVNVGVEMEEIGKSKIAFETRQAGNLAVRLAHEMLEGKIPLTSFDADDKDPACTSTCAARHACRHPKGYG